MITTPTTAEVAAPPTGPTPVSLPEAPSFLSDGQWKVLMALMDAVAPAIRIKGSSTDDQDPATIYLSSSQYSETAAALRKASFPLDHPSEVFEAYLAERPSDNPLFASVLKSALSNIPPNKKRELRYLLSILGTRPGALILTATATPLPSLPAQERLRVLTHWRSSPLWALRSLFKSITTLGKLAFVRSSATFCPLTDFTPVPAAWVADGGFNYQYEFLQFSPAAAVAAAPAAAPAVEVAADVVIVGSGCGAGVVANRVAREFGPAVKVLVLEKGRHFDASHYPLSQATGLGSLFEAGGVIEADDGSTTVTAGATFGGGGTVNWSASLQTQDFVRKEWARGGSLPFFEGAEFQKCLDRVWEAMGCSGDRLTPNHANRVLLDGAEKLGYHAKIVPQNCGTSEHDCGYCTLGCWRGEKKGPVNGWFPEAAANGVQFVEGIQVDRVLFERKKGKKVARGVKGVWAPRDGGATVEVVIRAKKVIVSCGTLWSPIVLMNSGLKNPQIGKNLYLHPTNFVSGIFDEDVRPWEGGSLTSVVSEFENLDGKGHGVKLEAMSMMPSFCLPFANWVSGIDYKLFAASYRHLNTFIAICRDRDTGHIYRDANTGRPRVAYTPSDFDRAHNLRGILELCKILYAQGAREIHPSVPGFRPFVRSGTGTGTGTGAGPAPAEADKKAFDNWLAELQSHGNKPPLTPFASAHQMGTCRMSAQPKDGVVDPRGKVWGTEGLYVADASVFPSASGVNPMVTVMAIADWIARGICEDLKGDGVQARL
ncbi:Long-chain-alcohol oxidase [Madurella fahalii]|uniref:Long-chain-alcohol oxidase n=1 Tax=Madurella fahalii TaxID=1157608 RepID=A0ABQ0GJ91_9PEZI